MQQDIDYGRETRQKKGGAMMCEGRPVCDNCSKNKRADGKTWCLECVDNEVCLVCYEEYDACTCDLCEDCGESYDDCCCDDSSQCDCGCMGDSECPMCGEFDCDCDDEFNEECVVNTFKPMNAFARARWIKAQKK